MRDQTPRRILGVAPSPRERLLKRVLFWAIVVASIAMVAVVISGATATANAEAQVAAARVQNAALQHTIAQTTQAIATAQSDDEIERAARRWGYVRSGDQPVVIVNGATK